MTIHSEAKPFRSEWITRLEEEADELEKMLQTSRDAGEDLFTSIMEARALLASGFLGICGAGFLASLILRVITKPAQLQLMDPGIGGAVAIQRGLQALGGWAPITAFGLGLLMLIGLVFRPLFSSGEGTTTGPKSDWKIWGLTLALLLVPFYDFVAAGGSFGLPIGFAIACGIYGLVPLLQRSPTVQSLFEHFESPWFGSTLVAVALGLFATGYLVSSAAVVMGGVLLASCFSLKLVFLGIHKRAKVREIEEQVRKLESMREEIKVQWQEKSLDAELDAFIAEREREANL